MSDRLLATTARLARIALVLGVFAGLGGCVTASDAPMASAGGGSTVAFDSIDGPPPQVFDRMVSVLDSETKLRQIAVVSRQDGAAYRVRSYLSAQVRGSKTSIAWVWDVYDRDQQRALRLSGEEPAGRGGGDAWMMADDVVLRRIAQAGLTGLSGMMNGSLTPSPQPAPAAPASRGPAIAQAEPVASEPATPAMSFASAR